MERGIYLVSGIPGAGKTTVSRLLAQRFARGVHIESDLLQEMIVTGGVWPDGQPSGTSTVWGDEAEGQRQLRLRCRNACLVADSFFEAGFTPIVDDVIIGGRLQHFRDDLHSGPLLFVLLTPDLDIVHERDATRPDKHVFDKWGYLDEVMRAEKPKVGLWLNSSRMTGDETVDEILRRTDQARIE